MTISRTAQTLAVIVFALAMSLQTGCQTTNPNTGERQTSKAGQGAVIGTLAGAVLGAITSSSKNRQRNMVIGAGLGAITGAVAGSYMDEQETKLREEVADAGVDVQRQGDAIKLNMPDAITFDFGSARLSPEFYPVLNDISQVMVNYPSTLIIVEGHTDSVGSDSFNQDLSVRRAQAVANGLISRGVAAQRIMVWGYGKTRPIASNDTDLGRARNRRVEITIEPVTKQQ